MNLQEPSMPCNLNPHNIHNPMHQGHLLLEGGCNKHIITLACTNTPSTPIDAPKNKYQKLIDLEIVTLQRQEDDLKLLLYKELHHHIQTEKINIPADLAKKIKLSHKQIKAIYQGNLQEINLFQLMSANTQFGYNIIMCIRANKNYLPGSISLET